MRQLSSLLMLLVVLNGCASDQQDIPPESPAAGLDIRIVTEEPDPRVCQYINDTTVQASQGDLGQAEREVRQAMKRRAANMGGNVVRLDTFLVDSNDVVFGGRVFKCDMNINPEAVLGRVDQSLISTNTPEGTNSGILSQGQDSQGVSNPSSGTQTAPSPVATNASRGSQRINPPSEPVPAFDEATFLSAGENEFDG